MLENRKLLARVYSYRSCKIMSEEESARQFYVSGILVQTVTSVSAKHCISGREVRMHNHDSSSISKHPAPALAVDSRRGHVFSAPSPRLREAA